MCGAPGFYGFLRGIDATLTEDTRSRWYLDTASGKEHWDAIVDVQRKTFYLANHVNLRKTRTRIDNIIVVGDRVLGLTGKREVVIGKLTPDVIERENVVLDLESIESVDKLGKIDSLARVPNSDEVFLITVKNRVYYFDLWGNMTGFEELPESVKQINSVEFNRVCSVLATTEGLFEVDIQEMPNMVRAKGLPRQIVHPQLREDFTMARYVEDRCLPKTQCRRTQHIATGDRSVRRFSRTRVGRSVVFADFTDSRTDWASCPQRRTAGPSAYPVAVGVHAARRS
jgi:hypothetical protein